MDSDDSQPMASQCATAESAEDSTATLSAPSERATGSVTLTPLMSINGNEQATSIPKTGERAACPPTKNATPLKAQLRRQNAL
jgi:hypothetical protein